MRSLTVSIFLFLFISCASNTEVFEYNISSKDNTNIVESRLLFNINKSSDTVYLDVQIFPKKKKDIESYSLVFDMKFREDYESEFNGVCLGPSWENFGPGEVSLELKNENNFKSEIKGFLDSGEDDRCKNYFYYLRFLTINLISEEQILIGVATDYAKDYPDAPFVWSVNENNQLEEIGTTNIEKYSLNFELSK
ncbi:MAG: hypothetical protein EVA29_03275 [Candidatus Actinomarinales bacterium]|nr:MAG: hypothetical protein EVA29_03275 [Candidatus Actinomarinales bacterium]